MAPHRPGWIVIGISGVTNGGKTTLSNKMVQTIEDSCVLHQDKYFLPDDHPNHIPVPNLEPRHNNYDILSALDMNQMYSDALAIMEGSDIAHKSSQTFKTKYRVPGKKILIIEGFTVLNFKKLYDLCDLRYYFVLEYGECFSRRCYRLYDPPDVAGYFELCVWPEHLRYKQELEMDQNVKIVDGARTPSENFHMVIDDLRQLGLVDVCKESPSKQKIES
ncbi:nicotinamide riboside kinase 1 [Phthorimaea operculella]|nr:nicotinamide riboside kinase 1 [Phthorimaea operculella]